MRELSRGHFGDQTRLYTPDNLVMASQVNFLYGTFVIVSQRERFLGTDLAGWRRRLRVEELS